MRILEEVVKNTDMGIRAINNIRSYVEDEELMHTMLCQREELKRIQTEAESQLSEEELEECRSNKFQQMMLKAGVKMNAVFDKSNTNIAQMMIEGTNMGINSVQEEINEMNLKGEEIPPIATELISLYDKNINELRPFL
ncbi:MAG TPA: hypothetical protein VJZ69_03465 [Clostridia bacterium]|nr:hypothetical protein [Clostridia bacterium]